MHPNDHEQVVQALEALILDARASIERADDHGLDQTMPGDYEKLLAILDSAIKQQRSHTMAMLRH
ncbi:hypothetical protein [Vreelandella sp. EE22]